MAFQITLPLRVRALGRLAAAMGSSMLLCGPVSAFPEASDAEAVLSYRLGPVEVLHAPEDDGTARSVAERARLHHRRIRKDLGLAAEVEATILLVTPNLPAEAFAGTRRALSPWLAGVAFSDRRFIVLRLQPGQTPSDHDALLAHELTHIILREDYPGLASWPRWFQEGLAMLESQGEGLRPWSSLSLAALRGRLIPLDDLWVRFPDNEAGSRLAYAQSFSFVAFLINEYGEERFRDLMSALRGEGFEDAFYLTYGSGPGAAEKSWRRFVKRHYNWIPLLTGGTAFWFLILGLFFVSMAVRRRRNQRLLRQWEEEEEGFSSPR